MQDQASWPLSYDLSAYDALLFDLDGTLVDTMPLHGLAYIEAFAALGYRFTQQDYLAHVGPPARIAIPAFALAAGMGTVNDAMVGTIHSEKKARFGHLLASSKVPTLPASLLLDRNAGRIPMAVVSSGNREGVEALLSNLGWSRYLNAVVSGDDVAHGKPHPEPYITAAKKLRCLPASCLAFEDTEAGILSGTSAGMSVLDVTRPGVVHRAPRQ